MLRCILLPALLVLLAACDRRLPTEPEVERVADVRYTVEGTYASCVIVYNNASGNEVIEEAVGLPWEEAFEVTVTASRSPYVAEVQATCTDTERIGKSTSTVYVDDARRDQGATTGPGNTSRARAEIHATP